MADENQKLVELRTKCDAIQAASRRRLGLFTVGAALAAPVLVFAGMWRERTRKSDCACSLPNAPGNGGSSGTEGADA